MGIENMFAIKKTEHPNERKAKGLTPKWGRWRILTGHNPSGRKKKK